MKKFAAITISLCTAFVALLSGGTVALADGTAQTTYPEDEFIRHVDEDFKDVSDYAVSGEKYAFAHGNFISVIENGTHTPYDAGSTVTALDCADGVFYYKNGSGEAFSLPDKAAAENYSFTEYDGYVKTADGEYKIVDNEIGYCPKNSFAYEGIEGSFSALKMYGGTAYALSGGKLYSLNGTAATHIDLTFTDYSAAKSIFIGSTAEKIKTFNIDELHFVSINANAYMTEVDLDKLSGENFVVGATVKSGEADAPAAGKQALLLCTAGENDGVAIITVAGKCYIMNAANVKPEQRSALTPPDSGHTTATVSVAQGYAYSSPFVCDGTKLFELKSGDSVKILGKVLKATSGELVRDFYKIEYVGEDGQTRVGYVPFGYVSNFSEFNEKEPSKTEDPAFSEDNAVKTVVLVLVVVALVLIAAGYVTYVATSGRKKKKSEQTENKVK